MPKNKRPKNHPQRGTWLDVQAEDGSWQAAASTGHLVDGLLHVLLPNNLHFKPFQYLSSVRWASAQSPSLGYVGNPLMSSLLKRQDKEMKYTYTHVKQAKDDAGNPSGMWDACVKSCTFPKALGYVGSSDNQFVAACLADDAVKQLMAAGMPGQNYINFDDALRAEGLAHLGNPQVPEPVIHPELLNRVWQPAQRPPTLQPISVLERSVFHQSPQAPVSHHKRVCLPATYPPQRQTGQSSQQQGGGHQRSALPGCGQHQQQHQRQTGMARHHQGFDEPGQGLGATFDKTSEPGSQSLQAASGPPSLHYEPQYLEANPGADADAGGMGEHVPEDDGSDIYGNSFTTDSSDNSMSEADGGGFD